MNSDLDGPNSAAEVECAINSCIDIQYYENDWKRLLLLTRFLFDISPRGAGARRIILGSKFSVRLRAVLLY
jgi:hypothetical protein